MPEEKRLRRWLYLDFDGVLHPDDVYMGPDRQPFLVPPGELFMWQGHLIEALKPYATVEIILSTTWASHFDVEGAARYLAPELQARVIGRSAPARLKHLMRRGFEVEDHVARNGPDQWVAIDNDDSGWSPEGRTHLVLCDGWNGLGSERARKELERHLRKMHDN